MATDMHVLGPFAIPFENCGTVKRIESTHKAEFWSAAKTIGLKRKRGCYVFAIRAAKGFVPWYVGQATAGFMQETFTAHKRDKYNRALSRKRKGTPVFFFVSPPGNKTGVAKRELNHMEKELIQFAISRNPDICNVQNTKNSPRWTIRGVIRSTQGKPSRSARSFKTMLRIGS